MFGTNYFAEAYFAQGAFSPLSSISKLIHATTRFISGFRRSTRREV